MPLRACGLRRCLSSRSLSFPHPRNGDRQGRLGAELLIQGCTSGTCCFWPRMLALLQACSQKIHQTLLDTPPQVPSARETGPKDGEPALFSLPARGRFPVPGIKPAPRGREGRLDRQTAHHPSLGWLRCGSYRPHRVTSETLGVTSGLYPTHIQSRIDRQRYHLILHLDFLRTKQKNAPKFQTQGEPGTP